MDRVLTVLHVCESLESGVARHLTDLVCHTTDVKHVVVVPPRRVGGVTDTAATPRMRDAGADVHVVDMRRNPAHYANATAFATLARLVRRLRPDVVHGHSSIGGVFARTASPQRVGRVWTPNGVMTARPVIAVERLLGRRTDRVVAVSPGEADLLVNLRIVPRDRIVVIPNGIDVAQPGPPSVNLRELLGLAPDVPLVGAVGRLAAQKAPLVFVDACRQVSEVRRDAHFVLIGDGPLAGAVSDAVQEWDRAGQFHQLGALDGAATVLPQLDVLVQVSVYEGGPYVPLEAMRAGVPVVLSDVVGNRDTVVHESSGLIVPANDAYATSLAIARLLNDPALRSSLAADALHQLHHKFNVHQMGAAHAEMYKAVVALHRTA